MASESMPIEIEAPGLGLAIARSPGAPSDLSAVDDQLLIERAQGGDRIAFEALVHRYDRQVLRLALNLMHSAEDAQDAYQEAFLRVYRNLHRFRFECAFYTWLYRIVTNVCLDQLRRRSSRPEEQPPRIAASQSPEAPAADFFELQRETRAQANPERNLLGQEIGQRIDAAMATLSPRERMVFEMKHHQGLKLRAIGEALGTTEETAKNSLFRATRKLREHLRGLR